MRLAKNKKGVTFVVVGAILALAIVVIYFFVLDNTLKSGWDAIKGTKNQLKPYTDADKDFVPYDYSSDMSIDDKKVESSTKAFICSLTLMSTIDTNKINSACGTQTLSPVTAATGKVFKIITGQVEKEVTAKTCPSNSYQFDSSCVICTEKNENEPYKKCEVKNFVLPQEDADDNWITAAGDPNYLLYYQTYPPEEAEYWRVDRYSFQANYILGTSLLNFAMPVDKKLLEKLKESKGFFLKSAWTVYKGDSLLYSLLNSGKSKLMNSIAQNAKKIKPEELNKILAFKRYVKENQDTFFTISGKEHKIQLTDDELDEVLSVFVKHGDDISTSNKDLLNDLGKVIYDLDKKKGLPSSMKGSLNKNYRQDVANRWVKEFSSGQFATDFDKYVKTRRINELLDGVMKNNKVDIDALNELLKDADGFEKTIELIESGKLGKDKIKSIMENSEKIKQYSDADPRLFGAIDEYLRNNPDIPRIQQIKTTATKAYGLVGTNPNYIKDSGEIAMIFFLGHYVNMLDSKNEKFVSKGKDSIVLAVPNYFGSSVSNDISSIAKETIVINRDNLGIQTFHLASPCSGDLILTKGTYIIPGIDSVNKIDLYDFGSGYMGVKKGTLKYDPTEKKPGEIYDNKFIPSTKITLSPTELAEYEIKYDELQKEYDETIKLFDEYVAFLENRNSKGIIEKDTVNAKLKAKELSEKYYVLINKILDLDDKFLFTNAKPEGVTKSIIQDIYEPSKADFNNFIFYSKQKYTQVQVDIMKDPNFFISVSLNKATNGDNINIGTFEEAYWNSKRDEYCKTIYEDLAKTDLCLFNIPNCDELERIKWEDEKSSEPMGKFIDYCTNQNNLRIPWFYLKEKTQFYNTHVPKIVTRMDFKDEVINPLNEFVKTKDHISGVDYETLIYLKEYYEIKDKIINIGTVNNLKFNDQDFMAWIDISKELQARFDKKIDKSQNKKEVKQHSANFFNNQPQFSSSIITVTIKKDNSVSPNYCYQETNRIMSGTKEALFWAAFFADDVGGIASAALCTDTFILAPAAPICYKTGAFIADVSVGFGEKVVERQTKWPNSNS